jgi:hypothetical protein
MTNLASHHYLLMTGHNLAGLETVGQVFAIKPQVISANQ